MEKSMDAYTSFAQVYDLFMDNVPYEEWGEYLDKVLKENGIENGCLLDLGCGTGKLSRIMARKGYSVIGVDLAMDMLEIAMNDDSEDGEELDIMYLLQDMRELELGAKVDAVYSACDCLNYILEEADLLLTFQRVYECLDKDGLFIFDVNTEYKYTELMAENTFAENREESSFIWENFYDEEERINEYDLTLFISEDGETFRKFQEVHYQKCYSQSLIEELLAKAGFRVEAVFDAYTDRPVHEESEKITFLARR